MDSSKKLRRSKEDRLIAGVAGGVAEFFDLDATIVRVVWAFMAIFGGFGVLLYLIMWVIVPEQAADTPLAPVEPGDE
ncbi:MAG TPA: PspC domain-containing protein [Acidimicrobiia bacterium]|nr:PspC domain-containing protein [Acidimicrobiia bacterium]